MKKIRMASVAIFVLCTYAAAQPKPDSRKGPDLSESWPTTMTLRVLQDAGLIDEGQIDRASTSTTRISSEQVGKNLWEQVYFVRYKLKSGRTIQAIAIVDASPNTDMKSGPVVYVVSQVLQPEGKPGPPKR